MLRPYKLYLYNKLIDTVFYDLPAGYKTVKDRVASVEDSLISHDSYNCNIIVKEGKL